MKKFLSSFIILIFLLGSSAYAQDLTSAHFIVRDPSIGTGGGFQSSGSFKMYSAGNLNTSGDAGTSTSYKARDGFLQYPQAISGTLVVNVVGSSLNATWNATSVAGGYTVSGYKLGVAGSSGGPYTFTSVGNVLSYNYINQVSGDYFLILQTLDAFGNIIAVSNEVHVTVPEIVSLAISDNNISFGSLSSSGPKYANTLGGSTTLTPGHSVTVGSNGATGYSLSYLGPTLTSGTDTIAPATIVGSNSGTANTSQFALSLADTGIATIPTNYSQSSQNWDFNPNTLSTVATTSAPTANETLNAYYISNINTLTPAGSYTTTLNYVVTANF